MDEWEGVQCLKSTGGLGVHARENLWIAKQWPRQREVEDILQVIKSMENSGSVSGGAIGGVGVSGVGGTNNAMESTVEETIIPSEQVDNQTCGEIFPMNESFSSFERDLLSEIDLMNLVTENITENINESPEIQRDNNLQLRQDTTEQKQFEIERRCAFLMRRLRKCQARVLGRHVADENTGVLELAHHSVKKYFLQELSNINSTSTSTSTSTSVSISKIRNNIPEIGGTLNAFLQKIEKSCLAQSNSVNRQRLCCRYFGAGSRDSNNPSSSGINRHPLFGTAQIKVDQDEVENVAGSLSTQLHTVESNLDSDCTASSSGGESCDEMQTFNNPHQQQLPIMKRAMWRYSQERATIASRWTWLQAQISDLDYKIRQHSDLQRHVRSGKGLVILDNTETVNGYSGVLPGSTGRCNSSESELPASRTRPFVSEIYRKRKIIKIEGLHELSKRAARPSTLRCDCDDSLPCCALCTGRLDPTQPQEPIEQLSIPERIALVDPCYHPVLSFPDDVVHSTHFDAIMKSIDWQQKIMRGSGRIPKIKTKTENIDRRKLPEHKVNKYSTRIKKNSSLLTARIKKKMLKGNRERSGRNLSRKRVAKLSQTEEDDDISAQSSSSKHSSPVPSPLQHNTSEKIQQKEKTPNSNIRLRQNSYDIDNIVIPYSVAASTRLEKLQYKEILTPKWRLVDDPPKTDVKNGIMHRPSQDSDTEDVSDEAVALRHERSEREEYKRFMTYINMVPQNRIRHRRADSRADSGANTPDPLSPHPSDPGDTSMITSPPATPQCGQDSEHHNNDAGQHQNPHSHRNSSLNIAIRRRTIPRLTKEESVSSAIEDENEVLPYDPRVFPLPEDLYEKMLEAMPNGYWQPSGRSDQIDDKEDDDLELESTKSDTTESAYCDADGEDPNDPEWTVGVDRDTEKERIRSTAKR